jgi:hypothetical protein
MAVQPLKTPVSTESKGAGPGMPPRPLMPQSSGAAPEIRTPSGAKRPLNIPFMIAFGGVCLTIMWLGLVAFCVIKAGALASLMNGPVAMIGLGIVGAFAPLTLLWTVLGYLQRASDVRAVIEPLQRQLYAITGSNGQAEARIRRFNETLQQQLTLLRQLGENGQRTADSAMVAVRRESQELAALSSRSTADIQRAAAFMRDSALALETALNGGNDRIERLENRLRDVTSTVESRGQDTSARLERLLAAVEDASDRLNKAFASRLDECMRLGASSEAIGDNFLAAAVEASSRIQAATQDIHAGVAKFREAAAETSAETDRAANLLARQATVLEQAGASVSDASSSAEQALRESVAQIERGETSAVRRAEVLRDSLSAEISSLQEAAEKISQIAEHSTQQMQDRLSGSLDQQAAMVGKFGQIEETLQGRIVDVSGLVDTLHSKAGDLAADIRAASGVLADSAVTSLDRFTAISTDASRKVMDLADATANANTRYEALSGTMDETAARVVGTLERISGLLDHHAETLRLAEENLGAQHQRIGQTGQSSADALQAETARIAELRDQVAATIAGLVQDISSVSGQTHQDMNALVEGSQAALGALRTAGQGFGETSKTLVSTTLRAETILREATTRLGEEGAKGEVAIGQQNQALMKVLDTLRTIESGMAEAVGHATQALEDGLQRMDGSAHQAGTVMEGFATRLENGISSMNQASQRLLTDSDTLQAGVVQVIAQLQSVVEQMQAMQNGTTDVADKAVERLSVLVGDAKQHLESLTGGVSSATGAVQKAAELYGQESRALAESSDDIERRMQAIASTAESSVKTTHDSLRAKAAEIIDLLQETVDRIDAGGQQIESGAFTAISKTRDAAAAFEVMGDGALDRLETVLTKLDTAAKNGAGMIDGFAGKLTEKADLIDSVSLKIADIGAKLDGDAGQVESRLQDLSLRMTSARDESMGAVDTATGHLADAVAKLQNHITSLGQNADASVDRMKDAATHVAAAADDLAGHGRDAVQSLLSSGETLGAQIVTFKAAFDAESADIKSALVETAERIDAMADTVKEKTEAAHTMIDALAEKAELATREAAALLDDSSGRLERTAGQSAMTLNSLGETVTQKTEAVERLQDAVETAHRRLDERSSETLVALRGLSEKLETTQGLTRDVTTDASTRMAEIIEQVQKYMGDIADGSTAAMAAIQTTGTAFGLESASFADRTQETQQRLQAVMAVMTELETQSAAVRKAMETEAAGVVQRLIQTLDTLQDADQRFQSMATEMDRKLADSTVRLSGSATTAGEDLQGYLQTILRNLSALEDATRQTEENASRFQKGTDDTLKALDAAGAQFIQLQTVTGDSAERVVQRLAESTSDLRRHIDNLTEGTRAATESLHVSGTMMEARSAALLRVSSETTTALQSALAATEDMQRAAADMRQAIQGDLSGLQDAMGQSTQGLQNVASIVQQSSLTARTATQDAAETLKSLSDEAALKLDTGNRRMKESVSEVEHLLTTLDSRLNLQVEALVGLQDQISSTSQRVEQGGRDAGDGIQVAIDRLRLADAANLEIGRQTQDALAVIMAELQGVGGALKDTGGVAEQQAASLLDMARKADEQFRTALSGASDETQRLAMQIQAAIHETQSIGGQVAHLDETVRRSETSLSSLGSRVRDEVESMASVASRIATAEAKLGDSGLAVQEALDTAESRLASVGGNVRATVDALASRLADLATSMQTQLGAMAEKAEQALTGLQDAGSFIDGQNRRIVDGTRDGEAQIKATAMALQSQIETLTRALADTVADIDGMGAKLQAQADVAADAMTSARDAMAYTGEAMGEQLQVQTKRLQGAASQSGALLSSFGQQLENQVAILSAAGNEVFGVGGQLEKSTGSALMNLKTFTDRLDATRAMTSVVADQALSRLSEIAGLVEKQMMNMAGTAQQTATQIKGVSAVFNDQSRSLVLGAEKAERAIEELMQSVRDLHTADGSVSGGQKAG